MINLTVNGRDICRHKFFDRQVSDQKRIISYNLGMAFAKLYAEKLFDIPHLLHVEFLKKRNAITLHRPGGVSRGQEPDLVGSDTSGAWHVFEAKGVSGAENQLGAKIDEAKGQLAQVESIHGAEPETKTACATYIGSDRVLTRIEDPPEKGERRIEISREKFNEAYYFPFTAWNTADLGLSRQRRVIDGLTVEVFLLEKSNHRMLVGLEAEVFEGVLDREFGQTESIRGRLRQYADRDDEVFSVGLDGFFFQYLE